MIEIKKRKEPKELVEYRRMPNKTIKYNSKGIIFSEDKNINESLNEVLNLNGVKTGLVSSRMNALKTPYVGILIYWLQKKLNKLK